MIRCGIWFILFMVHVQSIKCMKLQKSNKDGAWTPISNEEILYRYTNSYPSTEFMEFTTPAWKPTEFYDADNDGKSNNKIEKIQIPHDSEDLFKNNLNNVSCEISGNVFLE
ncbi:hypothetical protein JYU34_003995 [Plutella xylostella]|uniref:Uncharacterized protein n=1 Tax=Plutella xylostella TaxID=51655 RepID=A0ABQ7QWW8_PLUXY|nr:hypothetical protein JYU34_003995 [Plutella xylostella]